MYSSHTQHINRTSEKTGKSAPNEYKWISLNLEWKQIFRSAAIDHMICVDIHCVLAVSGRTSACFADAKREKLAAHIRIR